MNTEAVPAGQSPGTKTATLRIGSAAWALWASKVHQKPFCRAGGSLTWTTATCLPEMSAIGQQSTDLVTKLVARSTVGLNHLQAYASGMFMLLPV